VVISLPQTQVIHRTQRPSLRVGTSEHEPIHSRLSECTNAHRTRFGRHIQRRARKPIVRFVTRRRAQCQHLGMRCRVAECDRRVVAHAENPVTSNQHRSDWNLTCRGCLPGSRQRLVHEGVIRFRLWVTV